MKNSGMKNSNMKNSSMKNSKFSQWLKSSKGDMWLLTIALVLLNLVALNGYFRLDLTSTRSYSLSKQSKQIVKTLEEPLCVKVFFSSGLPAPYNTTEQYLKDLLVEYKGSANKNFSYEFYNMDKDESQKLARDYRLRQKQIQEVKDNEVGFKSVYMGLALVYADSVEVIDDLTSPDGLEYKLTTTMARMINTTGALSGLSGRVKLTLYRSKALSEFGINGFKQLDSVVAEACQNVNKKNQNRIDFEIVDPDSQQIDALYEKYGIEALTWKNNGKGVISAVIEYGDNFRVLPIGLARGFFGTYSVAGLDSIEDTISESLSSLVARSDKIGYLKGFGTRSINDDNGGSYRLQMISQDKYQFVELDLENEDIPSSINNIVIDGASEKISDSVFYKLDQFLMRGGNLTVFADTLKEISGENQYSFPTYEPVDTGLAQFLAGYGIKIQNDYVMDKNCYEQFQQGVGKIPLYFVPAVTRENLNQKNPISKNLSFVLSYQNSSIDYTKVDGDETKFTVIAKSSPESWSVTENIILHPMYMNPPEKSQMNQKNLAVLLEGKFKSQYDGEPSSSDKDATNGAKLSSSKHLSKGVQSGKIFVMGTSFVTTSILIDEDGSQPISIFVRNVVDYMNGNEDLCLMRTKGLSLNSLKDKGVVSVRTAKIFNQYIVPLLIVIIGLIMWRIRVKHRKNILAKYSSSDERETLNRVSGKKKNSTNAPANDTNVPAKDTTRLANNTNAPANNTNEEKKNEN